MIFQSSASNPQPPKLDTLWGKLKNNVSTKTTEVSADGNLGSSNGNNSGVQPSNDNHFNGRPGFFTRAKLIVMKYAKFIGPGLMVSVAYMDPGNYSTAISAGATNQFSLLFVILLSLAFACLLQSLCIKLGSVTGLDLSRACKQFLPNWLNILLYFFAECAIIATDVAEVIGTAISLNILMHIPLPAGVIITIIDVLFVLMAYKPGSGMRFVRLFEYVVAVLVFGVCICLCIELAFLPKNNNAYTVAKILRGYVPSHQMIENNGIVQAVGILGATVMPHSLFLGSALVQPRLLEYDVQKGNYSMPNEGNDGEKKVDKDVVESEAYFNYRPTKKAIQYALKYSIVELVVTLCTFALFINSAILVISGAILYGSPSAADADLYTIYDLLTTSLAPAAGKILMVALLFSGQSAGIVCTMAGQIVSEGHLNWKIKPWKRRIVTRSIAIIPCLVVSLCIGKDALNKALNASQVVLSILLPFLSAPLIFFTCKKSIMRVKVPSENTSTNMSLEGGDELDEGEYWDMSNNWLTTICSFVVWIFISFLNIYMIVQLGISHGDIS
ncbi:related to Manganese transporter SMF1 [Saccharomycodes ludwigii]|uniref:Related to Manganese transporter SMF1 n=1 Tax=Saccharomycodes ludwigii TaxID=36035 RepID=A0A376B7G5_9ASCO|nr:hypothetical protein SCDLUD_003092 [Saccharomycodes ludwigii]KAH3900124.1 hypothetical protein SCDLUD_003092 [Saccharomycodes ludwigii]SSD60050.1 related to Manganese transporter SMF1 [Saccharomycodes ludwigii]